MAGLVIALLATSAPAQSRRLLPVPSKSAVAFDATHPLGDFGGRADGVTGEFQADISDLRAGVTGVLRVRAAALRTGNESRDRDMRRLLEVERYPEIRFTIGGVDASFNSINAAADVLLTVKGGLALRGVERPLAFLARARIRDDRIWVRGESQFRLTDFGIKPPTRLFFSVGNTVAISFDLTLEPAE